MPVGKDRVCPHMQNTSCPRGFDCWDFNSGCEEGTIHFLFCTDKNPLKEPNLMLFSSSCSFLYCMYSSNRKRTSCTFYSLYIASHRIPSGLAKEVGKHNWHTGFTHNLHIYLRNNTSQAWQSGTPDPFSLCALGLTVGDHQAELIRPERQRCLMSNGGREWRDNRWSVRLMRCSWRWATFLASCRSG